MRSRGGRRVEWKGKAWRMPQKIKAKGKDIRGEVGSKYMRQEKKAGAEGESRNKQRRGRDAEEKRKKK